MLPAGVASRPPRAAGSGTRVTVVDRVRPPGLDNIFGAQRRGQLGARHGLSSTAGQQWGQQLWGVPMPSSSGGSSSGGGVAGTRRADRAAGYIVAVPARAAYLDVACMQSAAAGGASYL